MFLFRLLLDLTKKFKKNWIGSAFGMRTCGQFGYEVYKKVEIDFQTELSAPVEKKGGCALHIAAATKSLG